MIKSSPKQSVEDYYYTNRPIKKHLHLESPMQTKIFSRHFDNTIYEAEEDDRDDEHDQ